MDTTSKQMPTKKPYKHAEYLCYCLWKAMNKKPDGFSIQVLLEKGLPESVFRLLQIRTQLEFASYFRMDKDTLSRWNTLWSHQLDIAKAVKMFYSESDIRLMRFTMDRK